MGHYKLTDIEGSLSIRSLCFISVSYRTQTCRPQVGRVNCCLGFNLTKRIAFWERVNLAITRDGGMAQWSAYSPLDPTTMGSIPNISNFEEKIM